MNIGAFRFPYPVFPAPMAGVTDMAYRILLKEFAVPLVFTEMVSTQGIRYRNEHTLKMLATDPKERPLALQLFGKDPVIISEAAKYVEDLGAADIIDFNLGCPAPKIVNNGEGAALLKDPPLAGKILSALVKAVKIPVTVKIRLGWDREHINAAEVAQIAEDAGVMAITVHGRTRQDFYAGQADWKAIGQVKSAVGIPVIANGDVRTYDDLDRIREVTAADGVMIGRGAQGNPWLFRNFLHYLGTGERLPPPSAAERGEILLRHLALLLKLKGDYVGIREMRKHAAWYVRGLPGSSEMRLCFNQAESRDDFRRAVDKFLWR